MVHPIDHAPIPSITAGANDGAYMCGHCGKAFREHAELVAHDAICRMMMVNQHSNGGGGDAGSFGGMNGGPGGIDGGVGRIEGAAGMGEAGGDLSPTACDRLVSGTTTSHCNGPRCS